MQKRRSTLHSLCVYCGSSDRVAEEYRRVAHQLGETMAVQGFQLVYGAGSTGLMGSLAEGALNAGGEVVGVIPSYFNTPQLAHSRLTRLEVVDTIHQRKSRMAELADAFIALPGGYGTFEELFEMLTWAQIGLHQKPIGLLNISSYFDPLLAMIENALREGFIYEEHLTLFVYADNVEGLLDALQNHQSPDGLDRWITRQDG